MSSERKGQHDSNPTASRQRSLYVGRRLSRKFWIRASRRTAVALVGCILRLLPSRGPLGSSLMRTARLPDPGLHASLAWRMRRLSVQPSFLTHPLVCCSVMVSRSAFERGWRYQRRYRAYKSWRDGECARFSNKAGVDPPVRSDHNRQLPGTISGIADGIDVSRAGGNPVPTRGRPLGWRSSGNKSGSSAVVCRGP